MSFVYEDDPTGGVSSPDEEDLPSGTETEDSSTSPGSSESPSDPDETSTEDDPQKHLRSKVAEQGEELKTLREQNARLLSLLESSPKEQRGTPEPEGPSLEDLTKAVIEDASYENLRAFAHAIKEDTRKQVMGEISPRLQKNNAHTIEAVAREVLTEEGRPDLANPQGPLFQFVRSTLDAGDSTMADVWNSGDYRNALDYSLYRYQKVHGPLKRTNGQPDTRKKQNASLEDRATSPSSVAPDMKKFLGSLDEVPSGQKFLKIYEAKEKSGEFRREGV